MERALSDLGPITLGCMSLGTAAAGAWNEHRMVADRATGIAWVRQAFDLGIRHFDTAQRYGEGLSEAWLGEALSVLPRDEVLGASTLNIGTIHGGRAPNVVADSAMAEVMIRLVGEAAPLKRAFEDAAGSQVALREVLCIPAVRLNALEGFETTVVAYTTDIPAFGGAWGKPFLMGPGSIHVAHTSEERVAKRQLLEAAGSYSRMVRQLLSL